MVCHYFSVAKMRVHMREDPGFAAYVKQDLERNS